MCKWNFKLTMGFHLHFSKWQISLLCVCLPFGFLDVNLIKLFFDKPSDKISWSVCVWQALSVVSKLLNLTTKMKIPALDKHTGLFFRWINDEEKSSITMTSRVFNHVKNILSNCTLTFYELYSLRPSEQNVSNDDTI